MAASSEYPDGLVTVPFATNGDKATVPNSTPSDGSVSNDAGFGVNYSRTLGVDPLALTIDRSQFNQILNKRDLAIQALQAGYFPPFNAAFAAAIGGYPPGAFVRLSNNKGFWRNTSGGNNTHDPETEGAGLSGWVPFGCDNWFQIDITSYPSVYIPSTIEWASQSWFITGTRSTALTIQASQAWSGHRFFVTNNSNAPVSVITSQSSINVQSGRTLGIVQSGDYLVAQTIGSPQDWDIASLGGFGEVSSWTAMSAEYVTSVRYAIQALTNRTKYLLDNPPLPTDTQVSVAGGAFIPVSAWTSPVVANVKLALQAAFNRIQYLSDRVFQAGTTMPFAQAAAPTGWNQVVTDSTSNRMLRVVNDNSGGGGGGTHDPIINNVVASHTHGFTTGAESAAHNHGFTTGTESATHIHGFTTGDAGEHFHSVTFLVNEPGTLLAGGDNYQITPKTQQTTTIGSHAHSGSTAGQSANHTHSGGTATESAQHNHSGSTDNGSSQTAWQPRYLNLIICTRQ